MEGDTLRAGYLYAVTHPKLPGLVKIGITINPRRRLHGYNIGCPSKSYRYAFMRSVSDIVRAEAAALSVLDGLCYRRGGEWFICSPADLPNLLPSGDLFGVDVEHDGSRPVRDGREASGQVRHPLPCGA